MLSFQNSFGVWLIFKLASFQGSKNFSCHRLTNIINAQIILFYQPLRRIHGLAVYVNEGLTFDHNLSLENPEGSHLSFQVALLYSVSLLLFALSITVLFFVHNIWPVSANIKRFSHSTLPLMHLSSITLTSIIRPG